MVSKSSTNTSKTWIVLTFLLFVALLTLFSLPFRYTYRSPDIDKKYQHYHQYNNLENVINTVKENEEIINNSNELEDELEIYRPPTVVKSSGKQKLQESVQSDLLSEKLSGKVTQDETAGQRRVGKKEQFHPNNLQQDHYSNGRHTSGENYENFHKHYRNFLATEPPPYLPNFRNPCWNETDSGFWCLPHFYLAGFPKCGTTDLFYELSKHPDLFVSRRKEPHWWTRNRFRKNNLAEYLSVFEDAVESILSNKDDSGFHWMITGEGSASTLWDIRYTKYPENRYSAEPKIFLAHEIHHLTPQAQILVILRDPTTRLYSDYLYFNGNTTPDTFHDYVLKDINYFQSCFLNYPERYCAHRSASKLKTRMHVGLYTVYVEEWLKVFTREQIHILRLEDYKEDKKRELEDIFQFLGLSQLRNSTSLFHNSSHKNSRRPDDKKQGPMFEETKRLLDDFYRPFNVRLANLLNDEKYIWQKQPL